MAQQQTTRHDRAGEDAKFFREIREKFQLSQDQMARAMGLTEQTVARWEKDITPIHRETWLAVVGLMMYDGCTEPIWRPVLNYMESHTPVKSPEKATANVFDSPPPDEPLAPGTNISAGHVS